MAMIYTIAGYCKQSNRFDLEHMIGYKHIPQIRELLNIPYDDVAIGCYPISEDSMKTISSITGIELSHHHDWFFEPLDVR